MNNLRVNDIADAQARKMIARHHECRTTAICMFILKNAQLAKGMYDLIRESPFGSLGVQDVDEYVGITEKLILDDFRRTFGHDMIAPEPQHDRP